MGEGRTGGFRAEASLRGPSRSTGEGDSQKGLNEDWMEKVVDPVNVGLAYEQVKRHGGAGGVDGMDVEAYAEPAARHWPAIAAKLRDG